MATIDPNSPTWHAVKAWIEQKLAQHTEVVVSFKVPERVADTRRGAIVTLNELRRLGEQPPADILEEKPGDDPEDPWFGMESELGGPD